MEIGEAKREKIMRGLLKSHLQHLQQICKLGNYELRIVGGVGGQYCTILNSCDKCIIYGSVVIESLVRLVGSAPTDEKSANRGT